MDEVWYWPRKDRLVLYMGKFNSWTHMYVNLDGDQCERDSGIDPDGWGMVFVGNLHQQRGRASDRSHRVLYEIATSGERSSVKWTPANQATAFLSKFYGGLKEADEALRADHDEGLRPSLDERPTHGGSNVDKV